MMSNNNSQPGKSSIFLLKKTSRSDRKLGYRWLNQKASLRSSKNTPLPGFNTPWRCSTLTLPKKNIQNEDSQTTDPPERFTAFSCVFSETSGFFIRGLYCYKNYEVLRTSAKQHNLGGPKQKKTFGPLSQVGF